MTTKNPWLGLASYEEPKNDGNDYMFCGRDEETLDVVRLIDNNLFITLYGSSGIGKTSLLRAGVIPILRRKDYFPLYVRLSQEPDGISYAEAIVRKLQGSGLAIEKGAATKHPDGNDRLYLWNYFATTRFVSEGREVYPVIILDQFEEVFREGDKAKAELLLKQIYLLLNDELEMPDEAGYSSDTNYRFVASLREDFLFVLEDCIDENSLDLYKNNRYRLRPMKPEQARQVVLVPGKGSIEEIEKDAIADIVVSMSKRNNQDGIDTLLLSLICSELHNNVVGQGQNLITKALIAQLGNNLLSSFYERAMNSVSSITRSYFENHLLTQSGFRNSIAMEDAVHEGIKKDEIAKLCDSRLIRVETSGGIERIEYTHDALCSVAKTYRDKGLKQNNKRKNLFRGIGFFFDTFPVLFCLLAMIIPSSTYSIIEIFSLIFISFNGLVCAFILMIYRHTKDRNSIWLLLPMPIFIGLFLGWSGHFTYVAFEPYSSISVYCIFFLIIYSIAHFFYSLSFVKKRSFKEAIKYAFSFRIYKEIPLFKFLAITELIVLMPLLLLLML